MLLRDLHTGRDCILINELQSRVLNERVFRIVNCGDYPAVIMASVSPDVGESNPLIMGVPLELMW
jgi:hypothetical protein